MPKPRANICNPACPSRDILELLAEKWALLVIFRLRLKTHRTAELRREIGGVSEKMLIQTLRKLERHGLVDRRDFGEVPPRVEYELTKLGWFLSSPVEHLERAIASSMTDVVRARERFDVRAARQEIKSARASS